MALTGYGQDDDLQRTRRAGFDGHLVKPVDARRLEQVLAAGPPAAAPGAPGPTAPGTTAPDDRPAADPE
ncbi:MAG: hypothetical protein AMXMBFR52_21640 [Burkholderiales bacterium]